MSVFDRGQHILSNGFNRAHKRDRHTDGQTDNTVLTSIAIAGRPAFSPMQRE